MCVALLAGVVMLSLAVPASAATATERVSDGGFDQTPCSAAGCVSASWTQGGTTDGSSAVLVGPICSSAGYGCTVGGSGYHSASHWARVGEVSETGMNPAQFDTWIQQDIQVPASFPPSPLASLHFFMRILPGPGSSSAKLTVSLGGQTVLSVGQNDPRFTGSYAPVDVPLDAFVGPGSRPLRFEAEGIYQSISTSFDVDDVSVTAPDAAPAGPTGQRAAALAKCKHKHAKKRKKCKQRASLMPV